MNERILQQKHPTSLTDMFDRKVVNFDDPENKKIMAKFKSLSPEVQDDIFVKIKKQADLGMRPEESLTYFKLLVKGRDLERKNIEDIAMKKFDAITMENKGTIN